MCLIVDRDIHNIQYGKSEPFVAANNILVFKLLAYKGFIFKRYFTPFMEYPIKFRHGIAELSIFHPVAIDFVGDLEFTVNEGIHSIRSIGIHNADSAFGQFYLAIIPKGATFFVGKNNDMVSDHLIIFKNRKAYLKFFEKADTIVTAEGIYKSE